MKKIISSQESRQILRNLYKKDVMQKFSEQLRGADPEQRKIILTRIDSEVEERMRQQMITGR